MSGKHPQSPGDAPRAGILRNTGTGCSEAVEPPGWASHSLTETPVQGNRFRVTTPAAVIGRHVARDVELSGRRLRAGERIVLLTYVANNTAGPFDIRSDCE